MKKLILLLALMITTMPVFAEKIPVKIAPTQTISTHHDEIETGDWISFEIVNDVLVNDKVYIKKGTKIVGIIDHFAENGWAGDNAILKFKKFVTMDVNNRRVVIEYPLEINGRSERANDVKASIAGLWPFNYYILLFGKTALLAAGYLFRGAEIYVVPDTKTFNLFMETP